MKNGAQVFQQGERIYRRLRARLESGHRGQIVAIDPQSGQYILGRDELSVALEAKARFGRPVAFFRVGYPAVHKCRVARRDSRHRQRR